MLKHGKKLTFGSTMLKMDVTVQPAPAGAVRVACALPLELYAVTHALNTADLRLEIAKLHKAQARSVNTVF